MARPAKKQRLTRELSSDNSSSQILLNALQIACENLKEQSRQLSNACHLLQHPDSLSTNADLSNEQNRYDRSVDCAIKAWRSTSAAYTDVFTVVVTSSGSQPSTSRIGRRRHPEFVELARLSLQAKSYAHDLQLYDEIVEEEGRATEANGVSGKLVNASNDADPSSSASEQFAENAEVSKDQTATNAHSRADEPRNTHYQTGVGRLDEKIKNDSKGRKRLPDKTAEIPDDLKSNIKSTSYEKNEWRTEKSRHRREKKQARRFEKGVSNAANREKADRPAEDASKPVSEREYIKLDINAEPEPIPVSAQTSHVVPKVEYEDISAEIEARLKAKEAKRAAAKTEKKRKRESDGSFNEGELHGVANRPAKKKAKGEDGGGDGDGAAAQGANHDNRKEHEHQDEEAKHGESRSKRKKTGELS